MYMNKGSFWSKHSKKCFKSVQKVSQREKQLVKTNLDLYNDLEELGKSIWLAHKKVEK